MSAAAPGKPAAAVVARHRELAAAADQVLAHWGGLRERVVDLDAQYREAKVRVELAGIELERLADLTDRNLRLGLLAAAGYRTAADVRGARVMDLDAVPGVGRQTARGAIAAVDQLAAAIGATKHLRIDADDWGTPSTSTDLLALLHRVMRLGPSVVPHEQDLRDYARSVARQLPAAARATHRFRFALTGRKARAAALAALGRLERWDTWLGTTGLPGVVDALTTACREPDPNLPDLWADFEHRSAEYYGALEEIVPSVGDPLAVYGRITAELADRVAACPLDQSLLTVDLRGYQDFGARFVLNQGRVLLGDEMGLGKTIQAIAAMADRAAAGERHFLVVCPASVLIGWTREVAARSTLTAHRLHGDDRDAAIAGWVAEGGVGVTTFEGLEHVPRPVTGEPPNRSGLGMLVVDEAHYVKNPDAQRTRLVAQWAADTFRVVLMSGTPMENRLDEFLALVAMLQPDVAAAIPRQLGLAGPDVFRHAVAPVYLRRNQEDVLVELPDLLVVDEWEALSPAGEAVYREAVAAGSFMAMRRAAYATPDPADSTKLTRLLEIVDDAAENGHRVVVYSYFLEVIAVVLRALGGSELAQPFGPLSGSVPPEERQAMIDAFSAAPPGAVLVAQIQVGGIGLNIQAASVVVLCEPQVKPTTEAQAVARVHRMGQVRTVTVHRLLAEGGVDERMGEILAEKQRLFDQFVRDSTVAESADRAVDVTEARLARDVVAWEQARLGYGTVWEALEADGLLGTE